MTFKVLLEKNARRQLEKLTEDVNDRIIVALNELEKGFSARLDIKKLKGTKNHYRILFALDSDITYVYDISHRKNVY